MSVDESAKIQKIQKLFLSEKYAEAADLLKPLVAGGNQKARCFLASLYQNGLGVELNGKLAVDLYLTVAQNDIHEEKLSALAYNNLATIFRVGLPGVDRDTEKSNFYAKKAKELGFEM